MASTASAHQRGLMKFFEKYSIQLGELQFENNFYFHESVKTILDYLNKIDEAKICSTSKVFLEKDYFRLRLFSKENNCPIFILMESSFIDIQLKNGSEFLYCHEICSEEDFRIIDICMQNLLNQKIEEKSIWKAARMVGVLYKMEYQLPDKTVEYQFSGGRTFVPFWSQKKVNQKVYLPWVDLSW